MHSFSLSSLFFKIQGVISNQSCQERSSKRLFTKMISSISHLQDNSSEVVKSNIQRNSRGMYSSNITAKSDISSFSTSCSKSPERNPKTPQKGSIVSWETITHRRWWILMRHALQLQSMISLFLKVYFNLSQKPKFKKMLDLERTVSKTYQHPNRKLLSKYLLDVIQMIRT